MPVDYAGFWFKPYGFLDVNPAMNVPESSQAHQKADGGCGMGAECACGH
jgi:primary-amine oxidase